MEGGHCKPHNKIPIPTTGLGKPLTDYAPYSLPPLASLTDKVTHTSGLARCTGALHL